MPVAGGPFGNNNNERQQKSCNNTKESRDGSAKYQ